MSFTCILEKESNWHDASAGSLVHKLKVRTHLCENQAWVEITPHAGSQAWWWKERSVEDRGWEAEGPWCTVRLDVYGTSHHFTIKICDK